MTASSFNIIVTVYVSFILHQSWGADSSIFQVIQPHNRTVNPDGSVFISCIISSITADVVFTVEDIRLYSISSGTDTSSGSKLCQKGQKECKNKNIIMHQVNDNECLFIIFNVNAEAMKIKYQCEFTVNKDNLDYTGRGTPTTLLPGVKEVAHAPPPPCPPPPPPSASPPPTALNQSDQLRWILIGLLALMLLYSCVITSFFIRLKLSNEGPENSTYVVMRKAPLPRNPQFDIYCG